jgi:hypothetical protein
MARQDDREVLRKSGFAEGEVLRLSQLRHDYTEREKRRAVADHRRLEFVRWLVNTGKLSEQIAS